MAIAERALLFFLGGVTVFTFTLFKAIGSSEAGAEELVFIIGKHCEQEARTFLTSLDGGFTTSVTDINYDNGEFSHAGFVATVSHENLEVADLERYANGSMSKCWTSSFSRYELHNREDIERAARYINMLNRHGDAPILIDVDDGLMTVRTKKNAAF